MASNGWDLAEVLLGMDLSLQLNSDFLRNITSQGKRSIIQAHLAE